MSPGCSPPNAKPECLTGLPGKDLLKEMGRNQEGYMQYPEAKLTFYLIFLLEM